MKKSNVKRFDMGGYTAGMEAMGRRAAEKAANERDSDYKSKRMAAEKARRDEQIALDKADGIEEFAPEKYLIPGVAARSVLRKAVPAIVRGGADILRNEFMGPQTSEGLPTAQRLRDVRSRVAPGRLVRNKSDMERIAGYRDQYKPGTSNTRNEQYRREAEEMGIPYKEYLKGKSRAERASMGLESNQSSTNAMDRFKKGGKVGKVMGEFKSGALKSSSGQKVTNRKQAMAIAMSEAGKSKMKKFAAGGKTDKRSFASGDVFSNYDVGADPFLKSRKGGTFTDKEMKDGLTKEEIMRKTTPKEMPKAKKYAAGGNVKRMADGGKTSAPRPTNPFTNSQQYAAEQAAKPQYLSPMPKIPPGVEAAARAQADAKAAAAKTATSAADAKAAADARARSVTPGKPDMGVLPGYKGPTSGAPAPIGNKWVYGKVVPADKAAAYKAEVEARAAATAAERAKARNAGTAYKKGGKVEESKEMVKKEMAFMKKKGAPKSMIKHEEKEAKGMKRGGGKVMKFAKGGSIDGCAVRGKTKLPRGGK